MKEVKSPKKPLIYYYAVVLLVLMVFNSDRKSVGRERV